jgi:repressor LexA
MNSNQQVVNLIINRRKELGISMTELADRLGIAKSAMSNYENQKRKLPLNRIDDFAKILNMQTEELLGFDKPATPTNLTPIKSDDLINIPVLGEIAAGKARLADQRFIDYIQMPNTLVPTGNLFALRVKGDSMAPTIQDGTMVIIKEQPDVEDNEIAAVIINGDDEATLKRVKHQNGIILLIADNPDYDPIVLAGDINARIVGKAVAFMGRF